MICLNVIKCTIYCSDVNYNFGCQATMTRVCDGECHGAVLIALFRHVMDLHSIAMKFNCRVKSTNFNPTLYLASSWSTNLILLHHGDLILYLILS